MSFRSESPEVSSRRSEAPSPHPRDRLVLEKILKGNRSKHLPSSPTTRKSSTPSKLAPTPSKKYDARPTKALSAHDSLPDLHGFIRSAMLDMSMFTPITQDIERIEVEIKEKKLNDQALDVAREHLHRLEETTKTLDEINDRIERVFRSFDGDEDSRSDDLEVNDALFLSGNERRETLNKAKKNIEEMIQEYQNQNGDREGLLEAIQNWFAIMNNFTESIIEEEEYALSQITLQEGLSRKTKNVLMEELATASSTFETISISAKSARNKLQQLHGQIMDLCYRTMFAKDKVPGQDSVRDLQKMIYQANSVIEKQTVELKEKNRRLLESEAKVSYLSSLLDKKRLDIRDLQQKESSEMERLKRELASSSKKSDVENQPWKPPMLDHSSPARGRDSISAAIGSNADLANAMANWKMNEERLTQMGMAFMGGGDPTKRIAELEFLVQELRTQKQSLVLQSTNISSQSEIQIQSLRSQLLTTERNAKRQRFIQQKIYEDNAKSLIDRHRLEFLGEYEILRLLSEKEKIIMKADYEGVIHKLVDRIRKLEGTDEFAMEIIMAKLGKSFEQNSERLEESLKTIDGLSAAIQKREEDLQKIKSIQGRESSKVQDYMHLFDEKLQEEISLAQSENKKKLAQIDRESKKKPEPKFAELVTQFAEEPTPKVKKGKKSRRSSIASRSSSTMKIAESQSSSSITEVPSSSSNIAIQETPNSTDAESRDSNQDREKHKSQSTAAYGTIDSKGKSSPHQKTDRSSRKPQKSVDVSGSIGHSASKDALAGNENHRRTRESPGSSQPKKDNSSIETTSQTEREYAASLNQESEGNHMGEDLENADFLNPDKDGEKYDLEDETRTTDPDRNHNFTTTHATVNHAPHHSNSQNRADEKKRQGSSQTKDKEVNKDGSARSMELTDRKADHGRKVKTESADEESKKSMSSRRSSVRLKDVDEQDEDEQAGRQAYSDEEDAGFEADSGHEGRSLSASSSNHGRSKTSRGSHKTKFEKRDDQESYNPSEGETEFEGGLPSSRTARSSRISSRSHDGDPNGLSNPANTPSLETNSEDGSEIGDRDQPDDRQENHRGSPDKVERLTQLLAKSKMMNEELKSELGKISKAYQDYIQKTNVLQDQFNQLKDSIAADQPISLDFINKANDSLLQDRVTLLEQTLEKRTQELYETQEKLLVLHRRSNSQIKQTQGSLQNQTKGASTDADDPVKIVYETRLSSLQQDYDRKIQHLVENLRENITQFQEFCDKNMKSSHRFWRVNPEITTAVDENISSENPLKQAASLVDASFNMFCQTIMVEQESMDSALSDSQASNSQLQAQLATAKMQEESLQQKVNTLEELTKHYESMISQSDPNLGATLTSLTSKYSQDLSRYDTQVKTMQKQIQEYMEKNTTLENQLRQNAKSIVGDQLASKMRQSSNAALVSIDTEGTKQVVTLPPSVLTVTVSPNVATKKPVSSKETKSPSQMANHPPNRKTVNQAIQTEHIMFNMKTDNAGVISSLMSELTSRSHIELMDEDDDSAPVAAENHITNRKTSPNRASSREKHVEKQKTKITEHETTRIELDHAYKEVGRLVALLRARDHAIEEKERMFLAVQDAMYQNSLVIQHLENKLQELSQRSSFMPDAIKLPQISEKAISPAPIPIEPDQGRASPINVDVGAPRDALTNTATKESLPLPSPQKRVVGQSQKPSQIASERATLERRLLEYERTIRQMQSIIKSYEPIQDMERLAKLTQHSEMTKKMHEQNSSTPGGHNLGFTIPRSIEDQTSPLDFMSRDKYLKEAKVATTFKIMDVKHRVKRIEDEIKRCKSFEKFDLLIKLMKRSLEVRRRWQYRRQEIAMLRTRNLELTLQGTGLLGGDGLQDTKQNTSIELLRVGHFVDDQTVKKYQRGADDSELIEYNMHTKRFTRYITPTPIRAQSMLGTSIQGQALLPRIGTQTPDQDPWSFSSVSDTRTPAPPDALDVSMGSSSLTSPTGKIQGLRIGKIPKTSSEKDRSRSVTPSGDGTGSLASTQEQPSGTKQPHRDVTVSKNPRALLPSIHQ
eukprot:TRINITY_DN7328_c0_g1_i5.p1 TRINITY_DN7328_c0_g1~~TRINITY_DN7328_c0_g1_i5.p1  ORF type:complete len:2033 (-),score=398.04 TRINITY_DN7328_c0_g1_i5:125-6223(-)